MFDLRDSTNGDQSDPPISGSAKFVTGTMARLVGLLGTINRFCFFLVKKHVLKLNNSYTYQFIIG